jgi:lipopolysaccharide biosynthesis protein
MRRAIVLVHHDPQGIVDPHVVQALRAYRTVAARLVLVSTSARLLPDALVGVVDTFLPRENVGYDFGGWQDGLRTLSPEGGFDAPGFDEVVCVNDSVYGPIGDPTALFADRRTADADLWGMVLSQQPPRGGGRSPRPHLQSWFVAARRRLLDAAVWREFWEEVRPLPTKLDVITRYELGLSERVVAAGFGIAALHDTRTAAPVLWREIRPHLSLMAPWRSWRLLRKSRRSLHNPAELAWWRLLETGVPFVKVSLLRVNHYGLDAARIRGEIAAAAAGTGYDPGLVTRHLDRVGGAAAGR